MLGVTPQSLANLDSTDERLTAIARALFEIEDPTVRAASAQRLFGTVNAELLNVLEQVATRGMEPLIERGREMGVVLDEQSRGELRQAQSAWDQLGVRLSGVRNQHCVGVVASDQRDYGLDSRTWRALD